MKIQMILLVLTTLVLASCATDIVDLNNDSERPEVCPAIYDPVCGSDGRTYGNSCEAARDGVTEYTAGECGSEELEQPTVCPAIYQPVCGQPPFLPCEGDADCLTVDPDPKTYSNDCEMLNAGATLIYQGECNAETEEPVICPAIYAPVCGTNGRTYGNDCMLNAAKVDLAYEGECNSEPQLGSVVVCTPEQKAAQICTREYMPVCGNDGVTYGNKCTACAGNADNYTVGECDVEVFTCSPEEKAAEMCSMEYMPVCGNDGITYGNKCGACTSQIDTYTLGECA